MKALLWKDLRANRLLRIVGAVLLVMPFAIGAGIALYWRWRAGELQMFDARAWAIMAFFSLVGSLLTVVAMAGNAVAGERVDRSAEFLAYLPPTRRQILASKFIVAAGACAVVWGVNLFLIYVVAPHLPYAEFMAVMHDDGPLGALPIVASIAVLMFGAAWLGSALLDSAAFATSIGLLAPMLLGAILFCINWFWPLDARGWFNRAVPSLGILCFVLGSWYFLKRVEP